jgi:hypothetical protein
MNSVVVYESHWGNTAAIAQAIAEGLGPESRALTTTDATPAALADVDLIVAGAPVMAFGLPSERMLENVAESAERAPSPPDLSHASMREWLEGLAVGHGLAAAFDTRVRWTPGGATGVIERGLRRAGYAPLARAKGFVVKGMYGPLREGELDKAREWGAQLANAAKTLAR